MKTGTSKVILDMMTRGIEEWRKDPEKFQREGAEAFAMHWSNATVSNKYYGTVDQYGKTHVHLCEEQEE